MHTELQERWWRDAAIKNNNNNKSFYCGRYYGDTVTSDYIQEHLPPVAPLYLAVLYYYLAQCDVVWNTAFNLFLFALDVSLY